MNCLLLGQMHSIFHCFCSVAKLVQLFATLWTIARQAPCPPLSPRVCSNSCSLSQWCYLSILFSTIPFSFCLQSFLILNHSSSNWLYVWFCYFLIHIQVFRRQVRWSGIPISFKDFSIVNEAEVGVFLDSLAFSVIQWMLAIWSLVPLPFLNPACTSGSSQFTYCWRLAWRILLACEVSTIVR